MFSLKRGMRIAATGLMAVMLNGTAATAADLPGDGQTVSPVRGNWDTFWFAGNILHIGLERLGYEVRDPATLSGPAIYSSLSQGDTDFTADAIEPNHNAMIAKVDSDITLIGPVLKPAAIQGYLIDRRTSEEHNILYVEDLLKPEVAALFDSDGDGRAEMIGPSVGWGAETVALHQFEALGLEETVQMVQGEYTALVADVEGRVAANESVLVYAWYPNALTFKLRPGEELVWLQMKDVNLPGTQAETYEDIADVVGCSGGANPCAMGWLPTINYIAVNNEWAAENPAAIAFFEQVKVSLQDRVDQNYSMSQGERSEEDIFRHAEEWVAAHQEEFDGWIEKALAAAQ